MKKQTRALIATGAVASLGLAAVPAIIYATGISGDVQLNTEVATSIAMKIASPNDTNPDCMEQSGVTYGVANRYATSNGAEGSKQVDTFDGTVGGADELNTNTSCATLTMNPNAFSSTYSDVTVYTNNPNGYSLTVRSADNTSPNLVNTTDSTQYIPAGALTEVDGTSEQAGQKIVPGGQNKWAIKSDAGLLDTWTPVTTTDTTVRAYDQETHNGSNTRITYGISSGNNLVGKYATTLTYTATIFDSENPYLPSALFASDTNCVTNCEDPHFDTDPTKLHVPYKETRSVTIKPKAGHYIDSITCANGYTCTGENGTDLSTLLGSSTTSPIVIYVTNDTNKEGTGTINVTMKPSEYPVTISGNSNNEPNSLTLSTNNLSVPYGESRTLTVTPNTGYYLAGVTCVDGYVCTRDQATTGAKNTNNANGARNATLGGLFTANAYAAENEDAIQTGEEAIYAQDIKITNKGTVNGGTVSFKTAPRHFTATISTDANLSVTEYSSSPSQNPVSASELSITYGHSKNITVTPATGHYLASIFCPEGYVCTKTDGTAISTGNNEAARAPQNIRISNDRSATGGTVSLTSGTSEYTISASATNATVSTASLSVPYGESKTLTVTPATGYYLSSYSCPEGYTCAKEDDSAIATGDNAEAQSAQTIKVTNNNTLAGGSLTFTGAKRNLEVAITPSINATTSTNLLSIPYGGSGTFTITPNTGYYLTGVTCSSGYTCSGYTTGSASDPSATSRGTQTITVTNNSSTNTGAVSFTLANTYRISFSKTNISSPSSSYVDVAYGGSTTVTITPASGYYLSAFSGCPSGWTCSGVSTGTSYTGAQTLTLTNNNSVNTGTLTMTGTVFTNKLTTITYMQDMTSSICSQSSITASATLKDKRDNNTYTVAKLKDDKCWMTSNLKLQNYTLKSTDSNVSSNFTLPASGVNSFCTSAYQAACVGRANVLDSGNATYGTYYNWYAATAGTGTASLKSGDATSSICPKGWRLPTSTEFNTMYNQYGSGASLRATGAGQPAFVFSGYHDSVSISKQGEVGSYWSSTARSYYGAYNLDLYNPSVYPQNGQGKEAGLSVRCVAAS